MSNDCELFVAKSSSQWRDFSTSNELLILNLLTTAACLWDNTLRRSFAGSNSRKLSLFSLAISNNFGNCFLASSANLSLICWHFVFALKFHLIIRIVIILSSKIAFNYIWCFTKQMYEKYTINIGNTKFCYLKFLT